MLVIAPERLESGVPQLYVPLPPVAVKVIDCPSWMFVADGVQVSVVCASEIAGTSASALSKRTALRPMETDRRFIYIKNSN